jgi:Icc-related predicted phosphoesterase
MLKFVAVSDTHGHQPVLPSGDVLIHAGDGCISAGTETEFHDFLTWFGSQPHPNKIFVPGNHDRWVYDYLGHAKQACDRHSIDMLIDEHTRIGGVKIFGSPWTSLYGKTAGFMYPRADDDCVWQAIHGEAVKHQPDILVTHTPPACILDSFKGLPVGSPGCLKLVTALVPKYHIFGHVHENNGIRIRKFKRGITYFVNVAHCDNKRDPGTAPIYTFFL